MKLMGETADNIEVLGMNKIETKIKTTTVKLAKSINISNYSD